jgi:bifunctional lysine-specific demethylase and histidyl-hydroxylase MINA
VFQGRAEHPIPHPAFRTLGQEHHEQAKGELWKEVRLRPGDLLYLPRGQYHYALADDGPCAHIAFGVTYPIGLDVASYLFERLVHEPLARSNLPRDDEAALGARLAQLGGRIAAILGEAKTLEDVERFIAGFRYDRDAYDLPDLVATAEERWTVKGEGIKLVEQGGRVGLAKTGTREAVEVPAALKGLIAWTLQRQSFSRSELVAGFPAEPAAKLDKFISDMERMRLVVPGEAGA